MCILGTTSAFSPTNEWPASSFPIPPPHLPGDCGRQLGQPGNCPARAYRSNSQGNRSWTTGEPEINQTSGEEAHRK
eukprot:16445582-Heterocapsa_arctica.AAC.1